MRHWHYDTRPTPSLQSVAFRGKRPHSQSNPPSPGAAPPLTLPWRRVTRYYIKAMSAPPPQLRRMEYSVEVVWHERALC
ncbi:hypothetical protein RR46_01691 [Papilio xuthus]|uniref:Uncharacterized protein n=1 Tax=Papilio xuthus TaxID=66420 RepID=A0A0N1PF86_PAPXU|nr:hypothetical protein RR46_01691 [Papilio xuthus]